MNIFLSISSNICCGYSKEPSHRGLRCCIIQTVTANQHRAHLSSIKIEKESVMFLDIDGSQINAKSTIIFSNKHPVQITFQDLFYYL